ncbi:ribose 5-phosphate isomerase B [Hydrobacter penzbergensis]|jgi:ribose 5-phosphate isomerase B|uniref:Ribose 5-phosphate isomerase B n=1 Tax=Hydrobacter penzbergensis TaxID=1235997 RepID=A0A8X8IEC6_9BACT|nr:ribose 5-phosphate isomerase B [Hydrobacter penzbergensis]MBN8719444.1 ribose 5-phosphate isomerase B [Sediminibacterium magnilacihabitans]PQV60551.1 ribose 5-phosphate isomerase B [Sediminibacterium magnilacihabitans]SDW58479.1 ribose 5-phosphate isomerase B [Hydrobacter penzbergensis]
MSFVFDPSKPIAIGSDHAGVEYKTVLVKWLADKGFEVKDFGTYTTDSVDYPDFAHPTAASVESGESSFGILLCGSANGVAITANKHQHIRAGLCWENDVARLVRMHNNANIICIPARFVALPLAQQMIENFMSTPFEGGRHATRVNKIACA